VDNINIIQLRRQYLIGFLDALREADADKVYELEDEYNIRLNELNRLVENENTINEDNSNT
jgi:hypothetical protein